MSLPADYFEALYHDSEDPWGFRHRWYEKRKRELTLAMLPRQRYRYIFEPGCANGELSLGLAQRGERLLCSDASATAVALARQRLHQQPHVELVTGRVPADWPPQQFDLIVLSELGYYLDEVDLLRLIRRCQDSLSADGALLACHWLHPIFDCPLDGRQVHQLLNRHLPLHRQIHHEDADFLLELWCHAPCATDLEEATL